MTDKENPPQRLQIRFRNDRYPGLSDPVWSDWEDVESGEYDVRDYAAVEFRVTSEPEGGQR
jgi:hypothetical protein